MKETKFLLRLFVTVIVVSNLSAGTIFCSSKGSENFPRPFRVVLIIGDQWQDPMSYMVTRPKPLDEYSGYSGNPSVPGPVDFYHLIVLLKSWAIPFDIVRLDQQFLNRNIFLDQEGKPKYGTIIWDVNRSDKLLDPDYKIVKNMVEKYGIGFIALSDRIYQPEIQSVLGLKYNGSWESSESLKIVRKHFLTEGLNSFVTAEERYTGHSKRQQVTVLESANAIMEYGDYPQATYRILESGNRVVWIGHDHNSMFYIKDIRTLLRRAITWTIGYNLYKTWDKDIIMIMDDPGNAQNAWLEHWHYPALSEEVIDQYLIKPLKENNAILNINFVAGFVNDNKQWVEPSWTQQFVDEFGVTQDYVSSKRGYDKGVKEGVFEVLCHGLTHMQPDLKSDPGWYNTSIDQERAEVGWYREFGDTRRHKEIPAAEQLWRMKTSKEWLTKQFGVEPLQFCAGGGGSSVSYANNTHRLAGKAGFGWYGWDNGYLGRDMVIVGWDFQGTSISPMFIEAPPNGHDFGITMAPEKFATVFDKYQGYRFIGINEFIGYLHANNSGILAPGKDKNLNLIVSYDDHYCSFFKQNKSYWNFELSDWLIEELGKTPVIKVDGKPVSSSKESFTIPIPEGVGDHYIEISKME